MEIVSVVRSREQTNDLRVPKAVGLFHVRNLNHEFKGVAPFVASYFDPHFLLRNALMPCQLVQSKMWIRQKESNQYFYLK